MSLNQTNRKKKCFAALALVSAGALLSTIVLTLSPAASQADSQLSSSALLTARNLSAVFSHTAKTLQPSVVSIKSTRKIPVRARGNLRSPFDDLFGRNPSNPFGGGGLDQLQQGQGSGVIVSDDGTILTNHHVIEGAQEIMVRLTNGAEYRATLLGSDPKTDLAVLSIEGENLIPARLGNSDEVAIGEWVVAAGHPFGLSTSITSGIVSAKGRANVGIVEYENFIQTDAAINPGNSGGPLVNLDGEVIGINTAILSRSGGSMGIGFAIPINLARSILSQIVEDGQVVRGWLGVVIQNLTPELRDSFGFNQSSGVLIGDVAPDGPAEKAGLESGDILESFSGKPVIDINDLRSQVARTRPGVEADVVIFREGLNRTLTVTVGELAGSQKKVSPKKTSASTALGMTLQNMPSRALGKSANPRPQKGVLVVAVDPMSPASRAGLRANDIIESVQGEAIADIEEFHDALSRQDRKSGVRLGLRTGEYRRFVVLEPAN